MPPATPLIQVTGLSKSYGDKRTLDAFDLSVNEGEILGILGPNGSGKTTAVECMGGIRRRDSGKFRTLSGGQQQRLSVAVRPPS